MEIHNLLEDLVLSTVDELFDSAEKTACINCCTCRQCRMDVACYALNRLKPEYVLSGRGVAYSEVDYGEKLQRSADVVTLVKEGWAKINAAPRPNHNKNQSIDILTDKQTAVFNIKPIIGRLFNGNSFEPIYDAEVSLMDDMGLVRMMDSSWPNPYPLAKSTNGMFTFWAYPFAGSELGETRKFSFTVNAELEGFSSLSHYFELTAVSEIKAVKQFSKQAAFRLQDLYIFPE